MSNYHHCTVCDCNVQLHDVAAHLKGQRHNTNLKLQGLPEESLSVTSSLGKIHDTVPQSWETVRKSKQSTCFVCKSTNLDLNHDHDRANPLCVVCVQKCDKCSRVFKGSHHNAVNHYKSLIHKTQSTNGKMAFREDGFHKCEVCNVIMAMKDKPIHETGRKHILAVHKVSNPDFSPFKRVT
ncbi:hypothetical protein GEMRC1_013125 [Eukaryota sp. GEM-RC1]